MRACGGNVTISGLRRGGSGWQRVGSEGSVDEVAVVYRWLHRLCPGERRVVEELTVQVIRGFRQGAGPSWLRSSTGLLRLRYLTVLAVLEHRSWAGGSVPRPSQ